MRGPGGLSVGALEWGEDSEYEGIQLGTITSNNFRHSVLQKSIHRHRFFWDDLGAPRFQTALINL